MEVSDTLTVVALGTGTLIVRSAGVGYRLLTALSLSLYSFGPGNLLRQRNLRAARQRKSEKRREKG
jgi:hypothetical protein